MIKRYKAEYIMLFMNPAYEVLTNDDLLYEIMKWRLVEYISYPDIFIENIMKPDKNRLVRKALAQRFITLDELDNMFYTKPNFSPIELIIPNKNHHLVQRFIKNNTIKLKDNVSYNILMCSYLAHGNYEMVDMIRKIKPENNDIIEQILEDNESVKHFLEINYAGFVKYFGMKYLNKNMIETILQQPLSPQLIEFIKANDGIKTVPLNLYKTGNIKNLKLLQENFNIEITFGTINLIRLENYTVDELKWFIYGYMKALKEYQELEIKKTAEKPTTNFGKNWKNNKDLFNRECIKRYGRVLYNREVYMDLENVMIYAFDKNIPGLINDYQDPFHNQYINKEIITTIYLKGNQYYDFLYQKLKQMLLVDIVVKYDMNVITNVLYSLNKLDELKGYIYSMEKPVNYKIDLLNEKVINDYIMKNNLSDKQIVELVEHINNTKLLSNPIFIRKYEKYEKIYNVLLDQIINIKYTYNHSFPYTPCLLPFFSYAVYNRLLTDQKHHDLLLVNCLYNAKYYDLTPLNTTYKLEMTEQIYHKYKGHGLKTVISKYIVHDDELFSIIEKYNINYQYYYSGMNESKFFTRYHHYKKYKKNTKELINALKTEDVNKVFSSIVLLDDIEMISYFIEKHYKLISYDRKLLQSIKNKEVKNLLLKHNVTYNSNIDYGKSYQLSLEKDKYIKYDPFLIEPIDPDKIDFEKPEVDYINDDYVNFHKPTTEELNKLFFNGYLEPSQGNFKSTPSTYESPKEYKNKIEAENLIQDRISRYYNKTVANNEDISDGDDDNEGIVEVLY